MTDNVQPSKGLPAKPKAKAAKEVKTKKAVRASKLDAAIAATKAAAKAQSEPVTFDKLRFVDIEGVPSKEIEIFQKNFISFTGQTKQPKSIAMHFTASNGLVAVLRLLSTTSGIQYTIDVQNSFSSPLQYTTMGLARGNLSQGVELVHDALKLPKEKVKPETMLKKAFQTSAIQAAAKVSRHLGAFQKAGVNFALGCRCGGHSVTDVLGEQTTCTDLSDAVDKLRWILELSESHYIPSPASK